MVDAVGTQDGSITYEQVIEHQDRQQTQIQAFLNDLGLTSAGDFVTK